MLDFLRELFVPGLVVAILAIVWSVSQLTDEPKTRSYYPAENPELFQRLARLAAQEQDELPAMAGVEVEP